MKLNLRWYQARLERMSAAEILWRISQSARAKAAALVNTKSELPQYAAEVRRNLPALQHPWRIQYFNESFHWQGEIMAWQGQPKNAALQNIHWNKINYRDTDAFGDPKIAWELNRHQFLRRWITESEDDPHACANAVSHLVLAWIEANPAEHGLNWCSSLELALRIISWQSCVEALGPDKFDANALSVMHQSIKEQTRHLRDFPSLYSSANNHRIGELVGELAAAAMFPDDADFSKHARLAWSALQDESRKQVSPDGVDREQAFFYHAYVMLYLNRAAGYAGMLGFDVPQWHADLLKKMQGVLDAATDDNGNWFEIGDRDDGDLMALMPYAKPTKSVSTPCKPGFYAFREGGFSLWKTSALHLLFRCGEFGYPSIAAHAHCDQLSVLLKIDNHEILTDSGTCSYHDEDQWRRYFRGTSAHNTLQIDGRDQADYGGPFLWNTTPHGFFKELSPTKAVGFTRAWCRDANPIVHQRTVEFNPEQIEMIRITDDLIPESGRSQPRSAELIWNFGPKVSLLQIENENDKSSDLRFTVLREDAPILNMTISTGTVKSEFIYHSEKSMDSGFYSRQFGQRISIAQLRVTAHAASWEVSTTFSQIGKR